MKKLLSALRGILPAFRSPAKHPPTQIVDPIICTDSDHHVFVEGSDVHRLSDDRYYAKCLFCSHWGICRYQGGAR